jgi:hypothetical protein
MSLLILPRNTPITTALPRTDKKMVAAPTSKVVAASLTELS